MDSSLQMNEKASSVNYETIRNRFFDRKSGLVTVDLINCNLFRVRRFSSIVMDVPLQMMGKYLSEKAETISNECFGPKIG